MILQLKIDYTACVYSMPITNEDWWVVDLCKKNLQRELWVENKEHATA